MPTLILFGTTTSPYVRRARMVAAELGLAYDLVNTFSPDGQQALRAASPIWKVPTAKLIGEDGRDEVIYDSHAITEVLLHRYGPGPLSPFDPYEVSVRNAIAVIDGALDALINVFYLRRDGVEDSDYLSTQGQRAESSLAWLDQRAAIMGDAADFGLEQIALVSTIDWIRFRETAPIAKFPTLVAASDRWKDRPSVTTTLPG